MKKAFQALSVVASISELPWSRGAQPFWAAGQKSGAWDQSMGSIQHRVTVQAQSGAQPLPCALDQTCCSSLNPIHWLSSAHRAISSDCRVLEFDSRGVEAALIVTSPYQKIIIPQPQTQGFNLPRSDIHPTLLPLQLTRETEQSWPETSIPICLPTHSLHQHVQPGSSADSSFPPIKTPDPKEEVTGQQGLTPYPECPELLYGLCL